MKAMNNDSMHGEPRISTSVYSRWFISVVRFFAAAIVPIFFCLINLTAQPIPPIPPERPVVQGSGVQMTNLTYARAPIDNPLKGIAGNTFHGSALRSFPHSLIFTYLSLRDTVVASNTYDWRPLENAIAYATNDGSQLVVRFVLDHPDYTNWIPQYLLDGGLWTTNYFANTRSPDYTNVNLRGCLTNFIAAFGAAYDGDPRIAFVQLGLLGCWGEWDCDNWCGTLPLGFIPLATQKEVYYAYTNAFRKTKLLVRYPSGIENGYDVPIFRNDDMPMGYYDDGFTTVTVPTDYTVGRTSSQYYYVMRYMVNSGATNKWKKWPYGGETFYAQGAAIFSNNPPIIGVQTWSNCVNTTHATYIHVPSVFFTNSYNHGTNALWGAYTLGYELWVKSFSTYTNVGYTNAVGEFIVGELMARVIVTNTGVAPFYYDWPIELRAMTNGTTAKTWTTSWALTSVIPGDGDATFYLPLSNAPPRPFTMLMRAVNPLPSGKPLRFANVNQHATITNWLTLGVVK
jgi:hypothetical protein